MQSLKKKKKSRTKESVTDQTLKDKIIEIEALQNNLTTSTMNEVKQIQKDISWIQGRLNLKWKQRAKMHWL